jgi:hypothetical protein
MMEAERTSETSVDNYFTRQYIPEDNSEIHNVFFFITAFSIFVNLKLDFWWANWQWGRVFFE